MVKDPLAAFLPGLSFCSGDAVESIIKGNAGNNNFRLPATIVSMGSDGDKSLHIPTSVDFSCLNKKSLFKNQIWLW